MPRVGANGNFNEKRGDVQHQQFKFTKPERIYVEMNAQHHNRGHKAYAHRVGVVKFVRYELPLARLHEELEQIQEVLELHAADRVRVQGKNRR